MFGVFVDFRLGVVVVVVVVVVGVVVVGAVVIGVVLGGMGEEGIVVVVVVVVVAAAALVEVGGRESIMPRISAQKYPHTGYSALVPHQDMSVY